MRTSASEIQPERTRQRHQIAGWALSGSFALFILGASAAPKVLHVPVARTTLQQLGWAAERAPLIGMLEISLVLIYLAKRTSLLGAVLFTGLLGGAIASQLRVDAPLFSHTLFGIYLGVALWGGLWLRDRRLRELFPIRLG